MISSLHIRNYALIKELDIDFENGLNIITGETGAGKSIIIGALGLILGERMATNAQEGHTGKCVIEGTFQLRGRGLDAFFETNDLDYEDETIIRREVSLSGKSRAFINDVPVTLQVLKELGLSLVDIHSQHSNLLLKSDSFRRSFVDGFSGSFDLLADYSASFKQLSVLEKELKQLQEKEAQLRVNTDFNRFQFDEINELNYQEGEYEENEQELDRLNNSEKLSETFAQSVYLLDESDTSAFGLLNEVQQALQKIRGIDQKIEDLAERVDSSVLDLQDVAAELSSLKEEWTFDEGRLTYLNDRQEIIYKLMRKHALTSAEELLEKAEEFKNAVDDSDQIDERIAETSKKLERIKKETLKKAQLLSAKRKKAVDPINKSLTQMLQQLGIPDAQFSLEVQACASLSSHGADELAFLFSANKGKSPAEVTKVASGGEISRIMLAIKTMMSDVANSATLVFDEIDLGISGEVAIKMGHLIQELSDKRQVISITHLPQIAAMGKAHFRVKKLRGEEQTLSTIERLSDEERVTEISEMIGGQQASATAMESAKELLQKFAGTFY